MVLNYCPTPLAAPQLLPSYAVAEQPSQVPTIVQYAPLGSAVAVIIVGLIAASIARRQWKTAHTKVQLDLYAQRLPTYKAVREYLKEARTGGATIAQLAELHVVQDEAAFIFSDEVAAFIEEIRAEGWAAVRRDETYYDAISDEFHEADHEAAFELWECIGRRDREAFNLFAPFLRLEDRENTAYVAFAEALGRAAARTVLRLIP